MAERIARHVLVSGRVQGVAFRAHSRRRAERLGVAGWVRNLGDGRVEAWVEGPPDAVGGMLDWLETGPGGAVVTERSVQDEQPAGHTSFEIRR
ncbi:acylphosphatase [Ruania rhizosphaerae]|uniref:acylphosphatase n=1 Tax=Ruania rhizosphaerae TaxID=1840413 RepID=UPI00135AB3E9|nr:acylphosphatase [Ruania rhizosphaerae]